MFVISLASPLNDAIVSEDLTRDLRHQGYSPIPQSSSLRIAKRSEGTVAAVRSDAVSIKTLAGDRDC